MGNTGSDAGEKKAFNVIQNIPIVGNAYAGCRAIVYAAKDNEVEARSSGIAIVPIVGPVARNVIEHVDDVPECNSEDMKQTTNVFQNALDASTQWLIISGKDHRGGKDAEMFHRATEVDVKKMKSFLNKRNHEPMIKIRPTKYEFWKTIKHELSIHNKLCLHYTGHGSKDGIVLADGTIKYNELTTVFYRVILDACHAGGNKKLCLSNHIRSSINIMASAVKGIPLVGMGMAVVQNELRQYHLEEPRHKEMKFYCACSEDNVSLLDFKDGSYFTRYICGHVSWESLLEEHDPKELTLKWKKTLQ